MRLVFVLLSLVFALPTLAAPEVTGAWNVTATETSTGTCLNKPGDVSTAIWAITADAGDVVPPLLTVNVTMTAGETSVPKLQGVFEKGELKLIGFTKTDSAGFGYHADTVWIGLELKGAQLVGVRRYMRVEERKIDGKRVKVPCFLDMTVVAKR